MLWENTREQQIKVKGEVDEEEDYEIDVSISLPMKFAQIG